MGLTKSVKTWDRRFGEGAKKASKRSGTDFHRKRFGLVVFS